MILIEKNVNNLQIMIPIIQNIVYIIGTFKILRRNIIIYEWADDRQWEEGGC